MNVIGLDVGRNGVKVYTGTKQFWFPSIVGEWNERNLITEYGEKGFDVEVNGKRRFIGELAENESNTWRYMLVDDKVTEDARFLALAAIHRTGLSDLVVVTGLPVEQHGGKNDRRQAFKELLMGGGRAGIWDITLNGERRVIRIQQVMVAVEGGAAFYSEPEDGLVRLIDAGSKTVNYITMRDQKYIYRDSGTLPFGFNTKRRGVDLSIEDFADQVAGELGAVKWGKEDTVKVAGGRARDLALHLKPYFPRAVPVQNSLFANAIGFYKAGRAAI